MDKMREAFERKACGWAQSLALDMDGEYSDQDVYEAWINFKAGATWQAAKSSAVPVVGDVVAWQHEHDPECRVVTTPVRNMLVCAKQKNADSYSIPLIVKPTTSITAAELDALRKDAERYRWLKSQKGLHLASDCMAWTREDLTTFVSSHRLSAGNTAFAPQETLDETIDAAIAGEKNHG